MSAWDDPITHIRELEAEVSRLRKVDIAEVLASHDYALQLRGGAICICGHVPTIDPSSLKTQQDYHRAHLAAALRDALEGR